MAWPFRTCCLLLWRCCSLSRYFSFSTPHQKHMLHLDGQIVHKWQMAWPFWACRRLFSRFCSLSRYFCFFWHVHFSEKVSVCLCCLLSKTFFLHVVYCAVGVPFLFPQKKFCICMGRNCTNGMAFFSVSSTLLSVFLSVSIFSLFLCCCSLSKMFFFW